MYLTCHVTSRVTRCLKGFATLWVEAPLGKSPPCHGHHWSSASGDIRNLIYHVTSQDRVIEGSCEFMGRSSSLYVSALPCLVAKGIVVVEKCF